MPGKNIAQINTIKIINDYLNWHNLPIKWNETGVCNGLAAVHAQYTLAGKENKFFDMLAKISDMSVGAYPEPQAHDSLDDDVDHFINQVVLAYNPHEFERHLNQSKAYQTLKVNGKAIKTDFVLPMVTSENNWQHIIKELDLQTGEVMKVASPTHAITVHKLNGQYIVFDPNYSSGKKIFQNEKQLLDELNKNVFGFSGTNLALSLTILKKEGVEISSTRRNTAEICKDYLKDANDLTAQASYGNKTMSNINFAVKLGDKEIVDVFLSQKNDWDADVLKELGLMATYAINSEAFEPIFNKLQLLSDDSEIYKDMIEGALQAGNKQVFDQIIQSKAGKEAYNNMISRIKEDGPDLNPAVIGGNPALVATVINDIKHYHDLNPNPPFSIATLILGDKDEKYALNRIKLAIYTGSPDCLDVLLTEIKKEGRSPDPRQQEDYLIDAIKRNDIRLVDCLIKHMEPQQVSSIAKDLHISVSQAEKTNLHILNTLQKHGAQFSPAVQNVMKEKSSHQLGLTEVLGVKLTAFVEYIQISLGLKEHLSIDKSAEFKQKYQGQKEEFQRVDPDVPDVACTGPSR